MLPVYDERGHYLCKLVAGLCNLRHQLTNKTLNLLVCLSFVATKNLEILGYGRRNGDVSPLLIAPRENTIANVDPVPFYVGRRHIRVPDKPIIGKASKCESPTVV